ncbi:MAG: hypothetical protein HY084_11885 [Gemmatimonadetes bacterium]|nr:hypothetical protein [Gemmatimonadota bacterium]
MAFDTILVRLESVLMDPDVGRARAGVPAFCAQLQTFGDVRVIAEWDTAIAEAEMRQLARTGHIPRAWGRRGTMPLLAYPQNGRPALSVFGPPGRVLLIDAFPPPSDADSEWTIRARWIPETLHGVIGAIRERVNARADEPW